MTPQNSTPTQSISRDCRDVLFASPTCSPVKYYRDLTPGREAELLHFGSVTLEASLRKWQELRPRCPSVPSLSHGHITQEMADGMIRCLQTLIPKAERKPILSDLRPRDWFNVGDTIASRLVDSVNNYYLAKHDYQIDDWAKRAVLPWYSGVVTESGNGQVSLRLDGVDCPGHDLEYIDFCPFVLHEWERTYFRNNLSFFYFWRNFCHNDSYADLDAVVLG